MSLSPPEYYSHEPTKERSRMSTTKIIVKNHGPKKSKATYVTFKGLEDVSVSAITPSEGTLMDNVWTIGELDVGAEVSVIVDAEPKEGSISHTVEAKCYSSTKDANISNNTVSFEVSGKQEGAPCEVKLNLDEDDFYVKFSVRTAGYDDAEIEEGGYYQGTKWIYPTVLRKEWQEDISVGNFVGDIPSDEWWHDELSMSVDISLSFDGDSTTPEDFIPGYRDLYFEVSAWDGRGYVFIRKPSDPLNSVRYGIANSAYFETYDDVVSFIDDLASTPLCVTLTGEYETATPITHDMRESNYEMQNTYDLRTKIAYADGGLASDNPYFMERFNRFEDATEDVADSRIIFAYTKEDGVLVGEMPVPIEDIDYLFITTGHVPDEHWKGGGFIMLKWDKVQHNTGGFYKSLHCPELHSTDSYGGLLVSGYYNVNVFDPSYAVYGNSEYVFPYDNYFDGNEGEVFIPDGLQGLILRSFYDSRNED